jgi:hypothetical protein
MKPRRTPHRAHRPPDLAHRHEPEAEPDPGYTPPNATRHRLAGSSFMVMSWTSGSYNALTPGERQMVDATSAAQAEDGTRHLLMMVG